MSQKGATVAGAPSRRRSLLPRSGGPVLGFIAVWSLFAILVGEPFMRWGNQELMLTQATVVGCAAVGATMIIIAGGIDLSVGSAIAFAVMVTAWLLRAGSSPAVAAGAGIASGAAIGALIGSLVIGHVARSGAVLFGGLVALFLAPRIGGGTAVAAGVATAIALGFVAQAAKWRMPLSPFIVTLGLWGALRGLAKGMGDNQPIYVPQDKATGWLGKLLLATSENAVNLPPGVWILAAWALVVWVLLRFSRFGRHVFAVGSNQETARLCGIDVEKVKFLVYLIGVGSAGIAAVMQFSYLSMGDPTTAQGYELKTIAAAVIGGASLTGGEGSIPGTLLGAMIMIMVDNGCTKLGLDNWVQDVVTGAIIVAAVALDRWRAAR